MLTTKLLQKLLAEPLEVPGVVFSERSYVSKSVLESSEQSAVIVALLKQIASGISVLASYSVLPADLAARKVTVKTTPTLLIQGIDIRPHVLLNPPPRALTGVVSEGIHLATAQQILIGDTTLTPLNVGQFTLLSLFINATVAGDEELQITPQALSPLSGGWVATANPVNISAIGESYVYLGSVGVTSKFSVSWTTLGANKWTFGIGYSLKDNIGGSAIGGSNTVWLGNANVKVSTWFPLVEGEVTPYLPDPNTDLYGIASADTDIFVFDL